MDKFTVILFANLKDQAGSGRLEVELPPGTTVGELKHYLGKTYPALRPHLANAVALVQRSLALDTQPLPAGAEVTLLPRISGGGRWVEKNNPERG